MTVAGSCQWSVVSGPLSVSLANPGPCNGPRTTDEGLLPLFRRLARHHFFRRHLHGALGGTFDDPQQAVVLGLADWAALGDLDGVAFLRVVLLVVGVQHGAALQVLAVLLVPRLVGDDDLDRLVALVRTHDPLDRPEAGPLSHLPGAFGPAVRPDGGLRLRRRLLLCHVR